MKTLKIVNILFIIVFLNACNQTKLLSDIDNLEDQVTDALSELQDLKGIDFKNDKAKAHKLIGQLSPYFEQLEGDDRMTLVSLSNTEKANKKFYSRLEKLEKDLNYSVSQLLALKIELKNKEISPEDAQKYFQDETIIAKNLLLRFKGEKAQIQYLQDHYKELLPKGETLTKRLTSE